MPSNLVKLGTKYHCCEELSGRNLTGIFHIDPDNIQARLFSYDEFFTLDCDKYISIRTEGNAIVSLLNNISGYGSATAGKNRVFFVELFSNLAIVGDNPWKPDDLLKRAFFRIEHTDSSLRHREKFDTTASANAGANVDREIFSFESNGIRISARYGASYSMLYRTPKTIWPTFEIEFENGKNVFDYRGHIQCIVRFFSALTGRRLHASDISISRSSTKEEIASIEASTFTTYHHVHELHGRTDDSDAEIWAGQQFAYAHEDAELSALVACLKAWVDRDHIWGRSTHLMLECLSLHREISANRLMAASKWFEEIPNTKAASAIIKDDISTIARIAADKAVELGYADLSKRITGSIRSLSNETNSERLSRLTSGVCGIFGYDLFDGDFIKHLTKAISLRGKVAHGYFEPESDDEFRDFSKSIFALEALCYLLTIRDLPIIDEGKERIKRIPFVSNYRAAF